MDNRILRSSTIVPAALYVERAADRQLSAVIEDMGRPAYVLVARQMGKTNLLLNMKRRRSQDLVIYFDLSNRFDSATSWFRNIIDSIIIAYPDEFKKSAELIQAQRENTSLEGNVEFDRHIRVLLRETSRKMIIILDEIDSLVSTPYSDAILAQVRSMYFSRASHIEYERLTYVLSGVIEPTDLIKDKNISPFNIGEKIYLNSFNRVESELFFQNAQLANSQEVADAVFEWANGNPRMTWDICVELELRRSNNIALTKAEVDDVVNKLYLDEFDRPPVDHIRTLVESDSAIRGAIVSLRYGKSEFLDQKTRSKLYLAGITTSAGGGNVQIANKIIDDALSSTWLEQSEDNTENPLELARKSYAAKKYITAQELFEKAQAIAVDQKVLSSLDQVKLAVSYLCTGKSAVAIRALEKSILDESDPEAIQLARFYLGLSFRTRAQTADALRLLRLVAGGPNEDLDRDAQLTQALIMITSDRPKYGREAYMLAVQNVSELEKSVLENSEQVERLVTALYVAAKVSISNQRADAASHHISNALRISTPEMVPAILLLEYTSAKGTTARKDIATKALSVIVDNRLSVSVALGPAPIFSKPILADVLTALAETKLDDEFKVAVRYCVDEVYSGKLSPFAALIELYTDLNEFWPQPKYGILLAKAVDDYLGDHVDLRQKIEVLKELALGHQGSTQSLWRYRELYINEVGAEHELSEDLFDDSDISAFVTIATDLEKISDENLGRMLFNVWHKKRPGSVSADGEFLPIYLDYLEMNFFKRLNELDHARVIASKVLEQVENLKGDTPTGVPAQAMTVFRTDAKAMLRRKPEVSTHTVLEAEDRYKGIERNQRVVVQYKNMPAMEKKFKIVESHLREGVCTLVSIKAHVK